MDQFSNIRSSAVSLTTANQSYLIPPYPITDRKILGIHNTTDYTIYVGGSDVKTTNGLPIESGDYFIISIANNLFACCGTGGQSIRIIEVS